MRYGSDCIFFPQEERGVWTCTCGTVNSLEESRCKNCGRRYSAFRSINIAKLKAEAARHSAMQDPADIKAAEREERKQARIAERNARKADRRQAQADTVSIAEPDENQRTLPEPDANLDDKPVKKRRILPYLLLVPVVILLVFLLAAIPNYLRQHKLYDEALVLLDEKRYEEAADAFTALGAYGDSSEQVEKNIPYQKACYVLQSARVFDPEVLPLLNLTAAGFEDTEHIRIELYSRAAALFDSLGNYKDSLSLRQEALQGAEEINQKLLRDSYDEAAALLEAGHYNEARVAFAALGDHFDCVKKIKECDYLKASELLAFCETYNTRDVFASISEEVGVPSRFSLSTDAEARLGENGMAALNALLAADGAQILNSDLPSEGFVQVTSATSNLFASLNGYKESAKLAERALTAGDFTRPFYDYCSSGKLNAALLWLNSYDGEFEDRDAWIATINYFLPYNGDWNFRNGDNTLIPYSAGIMDTASPVLSNYVTIRNGNISLQLYYNSQGDRVVMDYDWELELFVLYTDTYTYFANINGSGNFVYMSYGENGMRGSCEYTPY